MIFHYDGNVALCCGDMKDGFDLGNACAMSLKDVWFSEKHIQIVKDLDRRLRTKYPLCSKCPRPPTVA